MLIPVADVASALRSVKPFPDQQIVVTAITGPPMPYGVKWLSPPITDTGPWPYVAHSCTASDGSDADPAVRINQWVQSFGDNGIFLPICTDNYGSALDRLAALLSVASPTN